MSIAIFVNDVSTDLDAESFILGDCDIPSSKSGIIESKNIADKMHSICDSIHLLVSSHLSRSLTLCHKVRMKYPNLSTKKVIVSKSLAERNFGILNKTKFNILGDIFNHTRILPEGGESVASCRERAILFISKICSENKKKNILFCSHSFICQIIFNVLCQKNHCFITQFWMNKGSFCLFEYTVGSYGINWRFVNAYNAVDNRQYTQEEIYSGVFK